MNKTNEILEMLQYDSMDFIERVEEILLPDIENDVCMDLLRNNDEYKELHHKRIELQERYPCIKEVIDGHGAISLNEEEHKALVEYLDLLSKSNSIERMQLYFRGHVDCFSYLKKICIIEK